MKTYFIFPAGNATILVDNLDQQINRDNYAKISNILLQKNKDIEQVGFIEKWDKCQYRCQMMGGEFCINAMRSLAFWVNEKFWESTIELESSGTSDTFFVEIENWVAIYLKKKYQIKKMGNNLTLVELEWIAHFVQTIKKTEWDKKKFTNLFNKIQIKYPLLFEASPAIGLISVDEFNKIYPLVFVKDTNTLIFESACGSGTLAAFIAKDKTINCFIQPSSHPYFIEEKEDKFVLKSNVTKIRK